MHTLSSSLSLKTCASVFKVKHIAQRNNLVNTGVLHLVTFTGPASIALLSPGTLEYLLESLVRELSVLLHIPTKRVVIVSKAK